MIEVTESGAFIRVQANSVLVDEHVDQQDSEDAEAEANAFAIEILTGKPETHYADQKNLTANELVSMARAAGRRDEVDPGFVALNYADSKRLDRGVTGKDVYVFKEEALRVYHHDQDVRAQYSEPARQRAMEFVKNARSIYREIDPEEQAYMLAAEIDSGEQAIFGATRDSVDFTVATADRKALRKLALAPGCGGICA